MNRDARQGFATAARNQIFFLYLNPPSVAWDLRCHEQRPSDIADWPSPRRTRPRRTCFLSSQMNAIRDSCAPLNGVRPDYLAETSRCQKQETRGCGLRGNHTIVESCSKPARLALNRGGPSPPLPRPHKPARQTAPPL